MSTLELLAPAGDPERLSMALAYGADAVYLAGEQFGMRAAAGNFDEAAFLEAVRLCHAHKAALHVTCNTMPRNDELAALPAWLERLESSGADAIILADLGVLALAKKYAPSVKIHVSTQASVANFAAAQAWYDQGASRIVLARELSALEIGEIRQRVPRALELEVFAHGAMCVSYSGRCLLSNYMTGRDANRGACAQPCRYQYALVEEKRPGEYFPVFEENGETYIMNSHDMCLIDHLAELQQLGVNSIKLEGRAKSAYYTAVVTGAYRAAIDALGRGEALDSLLREEVEKVSHRPYSTGFLFGQPGQHTGHSRYVREWQVIARVEECTDEGLATLSLRNKFRAGDVVELIGPHLRPLSFLVPLMQDMQGEALEEPRHPQMRFLMQLPQAVPPLSLLRVCRENS